jgi:membrane fusion protein (multidrug efflux system)
MRNEFSKAVLIATAIAVIVSLLPGCKSKTEQKKEPPALKVLDIKGNKVPAFVEMVGQAVGIPTVNITARVEGYLQDWSFEEGSMVSKGRLLFTIEQDKYKNNVDYSQADLDSKTAAWEKAKLDVARLKPLLSTNAISQNDYDVAVTTEKQTRAAVESARSNLADAKLNLSYTSITSPITGMIGKVNVNPGNLVGHGEATLLTTVSAVDPIYVDFQMNETDYLKIMRYISGNKEQFAAAENSFKVYLTLSDRKLYPQPGKIDFIDRAINSQTGTIAMRGVVPNPDGLIKPGSFTTVNLILMERENVVVIPQSAIAQIQGKSYAFILGGDNKVTRTPIILGRNIENQVIVTDGLKPGDKILLEGFQKFKEGMQIKPVIVQDTVRLPDEFK